MNDNRTRTSLIFGLLLIGLGVLFLANRFLNINLGEDLWPFAVIGAGALFFVGMLAGGPTAGGLAIPGSITVMAGLVLLVQNTFNRFESWAYCWALIMVAIGIGMVIRGYWSGLGDIRRKGWETIRLGMLFFLLFGAFFELFIFNRTTQLTSILWPLALIVVGMILIGSRFINNTLQQQS